jgi:integrase
MNKPRTAWRQVNGKWTRSIGHRGFRVRLFQKRSGGAFYRAVWRRGSEDVACLHTSDRQEADRLGKALLSHLMAGQMSAGPLPLGMLCRKYLAEAPQHLDNKPGTQKDTVARAKSLLAFFGDSLDVRRLNAADQAAYTSARLGGTIQLQTGKRLAPVRARSVQADLNVLHAMLRWATTVRLPDGSRWLEGNPLQSIPRPSEKNPERPVASFERYQATRAAMRRRRDSAQSPSERARWVKMELALVIAGATARRLGAIRGLRWEDIDFDGQRITWRAEHDKKGKAWVVPYGGEELFQELRSAQRQLSAIGGWVFPGERKPDQPMDRHLFDKWLRVAEKAAGLPKLKGGLWHPYRRAWATARKHLSVKDVAAVGGWTDIDTLMKCYQHPDDETLLRVTAEERWLHEPGLEKLSSNSYPAL